MSHIVAENHAVETQWTNSRCLGDMSSNVEGEECMVTKSQHCVLSHNLIDIKGSPRPLRPPDSPSKSPSFLARQRLLRKYQRPHVSRPTGRKLCLEKNNVMKKKVHERDKNCTGEDRKMPRLTEISVMLNDARHQKPNGASLSAVEKLDSKRLDNKRSIQGDNENDFVLVLSESDEDDNENKMPHLHRVSSEEKSDCVSEDWQSDDEPVVVSVKPAEGVKERESLFEVLQHETQLKDKDSSCNVTSKQYDQERFKPVANGLVIKKKLALDAETLPTKSQNKRAGIFSLPDFMMVSEKDNCPSDVPDILEVQDVQVVSPELGEYKIGHQQKNLLTSSSTPALLNICKGSFHQKVTDNSSDFSASRFYTPPSGDNISASEKVLSQPHCFSGNDGEVTGESNYTEVKSKSGLSDSAAFINDMSELQEREDFTELYPDSRSSMDDLCEEKTENEVIPPVTTKPFVSLVERQTSGAGEVSLNIHQAKRRRHMTFSGSNADPRQVKNRERRRRLRTLSHGCTCCMDNGSSRKRRRRNSQTNRMKVKEVDWNIPRVLSPEQEKFVHNYSVLVDLRHKVFRLCQVLFPKLKPVWQLNPDTEQVDTLVNEITEITQTLGKRDNDLPVLKSADEAISAYNSTITSFKNSSEDLGINRGKREQTLKEMCGEFELTFPNEENNLSNLQSASGSNYYTGDEKVTNNELYTAGLMGSRNPDYIDAKDLSRTNSKDSDNCTPTGEVDHSLVLAKLNSCDSPDGTPDQHEFHELDTAGNDPPMLDFYQKEPVIESSLDIPKNVSETGNSWGLNILETIQEEPSVLDESFNLQIREQNCEKDGKMLPVFTTSKGTTTCSLWGSTVNKSWESEFMKYLSDRSVKSLSSKPSNDLTSQNRENSLIDQLSAKKVDLCVTLCKDPFSCLTQLRKKVIYLLKPLLPNLTFENNFDKYSDEVDVLVDLVIQSNETKGARSKRWSRKDKNSVD